MEYGNGPDQIIPSESLTTCSITGAVKIRDSKEARKYEPISIVKLIKSAAERFPDRAALATKQSDGSWKQVNFREYHQKIRECAKAFIHLGLQHHYSVSIIGFNSEEWLISDLAAIYAGGVAVGVYTTNSAESCFHCLDASRTNIVVVEDEKQLDKIMSIRSRLPDLKAIIQYTGTPPADPMIYSWEKMMEIGKCQPDSVLDYVTKKIAINQCCTLVFTSGTVGKPKAVMVSHDNIIFATKVITDYLNLDCSGGAIISYLPLSHIAAQMLDIYVPFFIGSTIYFADKQALKGSLLNTMQEVHPTQFLGVPRVWEKMHEKMVEAGSQSGFIKKAIANWAKGHGLQRNLNKMNGICSDGWGYCLAKSLVFSKVRERIGLSKVHNCITAAAPLSNEIKKFFMALDIVILDVFGMSEVSGPHAVSRNDNFRLGSVGKPLPAMFTKIINQDADGNGEICMNGRNIFMGYLNEPEKTKETIDDEGWVHSGDLGKLDKDGFLYVTGRIKELIITAGGENIPPINIESLVLTELPHISNAVLIGDGRKFLSILLTLKTEVDPESTAPLDLLTPSTVMWLEELGCEVKTLTEVLANKDPKLLAAIQKGIDRVNAQAVSNAQRIQKFQILPADFSIPTGELGPTMKLRRNVIMKKYSDVIDSFYY